MISWGNFQVFEHGSVPLLTLSRIEECTADILDLESLIEIERTVALVYRLHLWVGRRGFGIFRCELDGVPSQPWLPYSDVFLAVKLLSHELQ